jgi:hypothetical protein
VKPVAAEDQKLEKELADAKMEIERLKMFPDGPPSSVVFYRKMFFNVRPMDANAQRISDACIVAEMHNTRLSQENEQLKKKSAPVLSEQLDAQTSRIRELEDTVFNLRAENVSINEALTKRDATVNELEKRTEFLEHVLLTNDINGPFANYMQCPVCLDCKSIEGNEFSVMHCGHTVCTDCMVHIHAYAMGRCPTCRERSNYTTLRFS